MPEDEGGWDVESLLPYTPPSWVEVRGSSRGSFRVQCEGMPCLPPTGLKNRRRYVTHPARPLTARRIGVDSIAGLQWLVHERLMLQPNQGARASSAASQLSLLPIYTPLPQWPRCFSARLTLSSQPHTSLLPPIPATASPLSLARPTLSPSLAVLS